MSRYLNDPRVTPVANGYQVSDPQVGDWMVLADGDGGWFTTGGRGVLGPTFRDPDDAIANVLGEPQV